jgi:hypothetical protein
MATKTQGNKATREYDAYRHARARCNNRNDKNYGTTGGVGIQFKFESFEDFYTKLGPRPPGTRLTRINLKDHFEPGNVEWNAIKGFHRMPEFEIYKQAKKRCQNQGHKDYRRYGGRGIQFRFHSFEEFYKELGLRPVGMTLDRIDNNGHYEVGNVQWATRKQQIDNRRPRSEWHKRIVAAPSETLALEKSA